MLALHKAFWQFYNSLDGALQQSGEIIKFMNKKKKRGFRDDANRVARAAFHARRAKRARIS
jgi:hypothetical protein